jgi:hypothetical protein
MSETNYNVIAPENGVPIKAWTKVSNWRIRRVSS